LHVPSPPVYAVGSAYSCGCFVHPVVPRLSRHHRPASVTTATLDLSAAGHQQESGILPLILAVILCTALDRTAQPERPATAFRPPRAVYLTQIPGAAALRPMCRPGREDRRRGGAGDAGRWSARRTRCWATCYASTGNASGSPRRRWPSASPPS